MKLNKEERKILINVLEERLELAESFEENLVKKVVFHGIGIIGGIEMVLNDSFKPMQDLLKRLKDKK